MQEVVETLVWSVAATVVAVAFLLVGFCRAVYAVHAEDLASISRIERDRDEWQAKAGLRNKNEAIAQALRQPLHYAVHQLSNRPIDSGNSTEVIEWKRDIGRWEQETRALMQTTGCAPIEIDRFWDLTWADLNAINLELHPNTLIDHYRKVIQYRIGALRKIINNYSDRQIF